MEEIFENVFSNGRNLFTKSIAKGERVYGEKIISQGNDEYREWDIMRSKLSAAITKGLKGMPIKKGSTVLYLGASTGTTVSHVSDIVENNGLVISVEIAPRMMQSLIKLAEKRQNIIPILGDAGNPSEYSDIGKVDVIYEDVAQKEQTDILIKNANAFLKKGGYAMYCIKSQSIDVTKDPKVVFIEEEKKLLPYFEVLQRIDLEPYDKEHMFLFLRKK